MADSVTYSVSIDSSAIVDTSGYLDFQLDPASSMSTAADASVTAFSSDGTVGAPLLPNVGDATGSLPGTLSFDNGTPTNEITQGFTFGNTIQFDVTLSGAAVGSSGPDTTSFFITLFDGGFNAYSAGPGGAIGEIDINPDGTTTQLTYGPIVTPGPTATISLVSTVPEPGSLSLVAIAGVVSLAARWRHHRRRDVA